MSIYLSELNIYPIKSTKRISITDSEVLFSGLKGDRRYMLVDSQGVFVTARSHPALTLIKTIPINGGLQVEDHTGTSTLKLYEETLCGRTLSVDIWETIVTAHEVSDEANKWFSNLLNLPVKLVFFGEQSMRYTSRRVTQPVGFADGYPFLLTCDTSLEELNETTAHPIEMSRFRPNIVIAGSKPFEEDSWKRIKIGDVIFENVKPCVRCIFTTLDPLTAQRSPKGEPLKSLVKFRLAGKEGVTFGINLVAENEGKINVGDLVEVLEYQEPERYIDRRKSKC